MRAPPGPPGVTALVLADADGMICYWNRGAEALTGSAAAVLVTPAEGDPPRFDLWRARPAQARTG
jgi:PAS domain-containing protein